MNDWSDLLSPIVAALADAQSLSEADASREQVVETGLATAAKIVGVLLLLAIYSLLRQRQKRQLERLEEARLRSRKRR